MRLRDIHGDGEGASWLATEFLPALRSTNSPYLHMEAAEPSFLRLMAGGAPQVWARVAADCYGYWYLRSVSGQREWSPVSPFTLAAARKVPGEQGSPRWYAAWARLFFGQLESTDRSPLHAGRWWLTPCGTDLRDDPVSRPAGRLWPSVPRAVHLDRLPGQPAHDYVDWDLHEPPPLALRPLSDENDGRVKAWRRASREGCLPPVLLLWVSGLLRYVVLDGHDRLLAALLEGHAPPLLALLPVTESVHEVDLRKQEALQKVVEESLCAPRDTGPQRGRSLSIETANRLLIEAYDDRPSLAVISRAWSLNGGVSSWREEVRAEFRRHPAASEVDSAMLAPDE